MLSDKEVDKLINALERQREYGDALYCKPATREIIRDWFEAAQQSVQRTATAEHVFPCLEPECEICETLRQA